ncbi:hypothetical protein BASA81_012557 [Batrachochytrium salamandrivorans]|nr:hypothetical protein BASA81_012557 [Batrachochytrium salamandrivorans]
MNRCRACQSDRLFEDDEGQVVCDGCGTIVQATQQIAALMEMETVVAADLKLARRKAPALSNKRVKTQEELEAQRLELQRVNQKHNQDLYDLLPKLMLAFKRDVGVLYLDEASVKSGAELVIENSKSSQRVLRLAALMFDCSQDPFLMASDMTSFGTTGIFPLMERGMCMERGPGLFLMKSQHVRAMNWKAVAFRCTIRLAKVLEMQWYELWRAVYLVLFAMRGIESLESLHGFGLPSSIAACAVLVPGWQQLVFKTKLRGNTVSSFRFAPLQGTLSRPTLDLLNHVATNKQERHRHFARQDLGLDELNAMPPNQFLKDIFHSRVAKKVTMQESPVFCNGRCLKKLPPLTSNESGDTPSLILPEIGLGVWLTIKWHSEDLVASDLDQALVDLVDLVSTALDKGLGLFPPHRESNEAKTTLNLHNKFHHFISRDRFHIKDEIFTLVKYIQTRRQQEQPPQEEAKLADWLQDTKEIMEMGCQTILLCPRDPELVRDEQLQYANTDDEEEI